MAVGIPPAIARSEEVKWLLALMGISEASGLDGVAAFSLEQRMALLHFITGQRNLPNTGVEAALHFGECFSRSRKSMETSQPETEGWGHISAFSLVLRRGWETGKTV